MSQKEFNAKFLLEKVFLKEYLELCKKHQLEIDNDFELEELNTMPINEFRLDDMVKQKCKTIDKYVKDNS
jgi:hypothetical protein